MIAPWLPRNPIRVYTERSAENYTAALAQLSVETDERYKPRLRKTWCNIFMWDGSRTLGCEVPHWYMPDDGRAAQPFAHGALEMSANGAQVWFEDFGKTHGWVRTPNPEAVELANAGHPVILQWTNKLGSGHVGFLTPGGKVTQAGAKNGTFTPREVFGDRLYTCWSHQ